MESKQKSTPGQTQRVLDDYMLGGYRMGDANCEAFVNELLENFDDISKHVRMSQTTTPSPTPPRRRIALRLSAIGFCRSANQPIHLLTELGCGAAPRDVDPTGCEGGAA